MTRLRPGPSLALGAALLVVAACDQDMADMPRNEAYERSKVLPGGTSAQPPVRGTVPRSVDIGPIPESIPVPVTASLLARGRERFNIFCVPCHGLVGDGSGMIVQRGFPAPPSYHSDRLRAAPDRHFFEVITRGYGAMYSYAARVPPADRWAIVAYIRALQLSQYADAATLPAEDAARIGKAGR